MASYLGRNVNLALLVIIIGVVVALVGTTVFFQRGLQNRTDEYTSTAVTLSQCQTTLANYESSLATAQEKVNTTAQDIKKYDQLYEQKTGELKDTQSQLAQSQRDLALQKQVSDDLANRLSSAQSTNLQLNQTLQYQAGQISNLNSQVSSLYSRISTCQSRLQPGMSC